MTDRLDLLKQIYVPRSLGSDELLNSNDSGSNDTDPDLTIGVRYVADKYWPVLAEETVANLIPVSADIMREVVADKLWCPWRLERDRFIFHTKRWKATRNSVKIYDDVTVYHQDLMMRGIHTYTDLITLVRLAEG